MKKLTKKWQLLIYALAGMGINMLNLMMNSYLCSALLIGGFGEAAIPYQTFLGRDLIVPTVWAVFAFAAKIIDGIIDIPMASVTDNLRSRFGRRRPSLVIGFIPMAAAYLLFLCVPNPSGATLFNTIYYGILLCIFYTGYTMTMVTYYATFTEIVESEKERSFLSNTKAFFDIVYFILGYVVVRMFLNSINIRLVALMVFPLSFTILIAFFMIKEPSTLEGDLEKSESVNLFKSIGFTFKNKPFVVWMFVYSIMTIGVQLFLGGINEFFSYVEMNMMLVMVCAFAPVPLTLLIYNRIMKKKGFGVAFRYSLNIYMLGMLAMYVTGVLVKPGFPKTLCSIVAGLVSSFAIGSLFSVAYFLPAQLAAEEEERTGIKGSAMYFAVQGLFAGIASGLATGVILTALKVHDGAMAYMTVIAALATALSLQLMSLLPESIMLIGKEKTTSDNNEE